MSVFRFKRFSVVNDRSAMKVNTDGVLLGASMTLLSSDRRLLDVGTGTGTIALMAAQRLHDICEAECPDVLPEIRIDAVEIDRDSAAEAGANFSASPWRDSLEAFNMSFADFACVSKGCYDVIFSNPPYFDLSLPAPSERRCNARHVSSGLSFRELIDFAAENLAPEGRFSIVLPSDQEVHLCRHARMSGLHLFNLVRVRTVPRKSERRIIAEFSRQRCPEPNITLLTIQNEGKYTKEYLSLTHDFYLFA